MVTTNIVPPSTATEQVIALQFIEPVCPYINEDSATSSVNYIVSDVTLIGTIAKATIIAQVTTSFVPKCQKIAKTVINTERIPIAFTATATNAITVAPEQVFTTVVPNGCKKKNAIVSTAITVTIA